LFHCVCFMFMSYYISQLTTCYCKWWEIHYVHS
jgi:hypothetical protein